MQLERFRRLPLLGIVRGITLADVAPLTEAVIDAGLETIEITMNTPAAPALISEMIARAGDRLTIGAGTVLDVDMFAAARDAGASFIVMPCVIPSVVERCLANRVPMFPGGLTPHEIYQAHVAGGTMVKVFPAGAFGPSYLREIKGPFADIELLACGGVTADNMADYFSCGASAVAIGGSVFRREWIAAGDYSRIGREVRALVMACRRAASRAPS